MGTCGSKRSLQLTRRGEPPRTASRSEDNKTQTPAAQKTLAAAGAEQRARCKEGVVPPESSQEEASNTAETKSLHERHRRRLSVSVTAVESSSSPEQAPSPLSGLSHATAGTTLSRAFLHASSKQPTKNPVEDGALSGGPSRSLSEYSAASGGSTQSKTSTALLRHEKSLPPHPEEVEIASQVVKNLNAEQQQRLHRQRSSRRSAGPAPSRQASSKGFCPSLPPIFAPLPFPREDNWRHSDQVTAQFLLKHFTPESTDALRCAVLGRQAVCGNGGVARSCTLFLPFAVDVVIFNLVNSLLSGSAAADRQRGFDSKRMDCAVRNALQSLLCQGERS